MSSKNKRKLQYSLALNEALHQMMASDKSVFLIGQGVKSPWYVGNTCNGLLKKFGSKRVIDTPVSENAVTGAAVGAAISGMKPIIVHPRMDFMFYAMDPIINQAANWHYMFGGKVNVPVVIWGIINRGGEQAAQHSQTLHSIFSHIPGLKVVMPATAYDAKGLMISAIKDPNPVIYIDDRWLYKEEGMVPKEIYSVPIGKGIIRKEGKDLTIVAISYLVREAMKAAEILKKQSIKAEVIDPRTISPLDIPLIIKSVKKTGRLLIADCGWLSGGIGADISARISESDAFKKLKKPIARIGLPDCPAPMSGPLEKTYYIWLEDIVKAAKKLMGK
ncbi:alpha-ketoacid dehydrogenase subunit beta [Candidatus Wolfebacteria bacterium CG03_land_8_20_14_0_80_36_15]|uniref:Alpha-ketoacid dehydrogenase subunit beta n=1 Tax=Candidatus Wolfebacteria bacterium CG03_land_8_20_14_0_80_36_15 TaxID=1975067 RepID=A0A2M7B875_9BACT|nr:MAG: alpha-ketoacid dehydrogenase subunit beta [Candidatus Wolfebacteria bacterium CG03_land_8_20_14_0_80_36_15]